jgi:TolB protein
VVYSSFPQDSKNMAISNRLKAFGTIVSSYFVFAAMASAQMPDRYPGLDDYPHQIYFEQHELPALAHGPMDPAPAPDGSTLAFAAQGWIWLLDLETNSATRLTDSQYVDSRPRWSPNGERLAFVRDFGTDTGIVVRHIESGEEQTINSSAVDLDPEFSADGEYLYYANGVTGSVDIWRRHLSSGAEVQLSDLWKVERNIRRVPGGDRILYLDAQDPHRSLRIRDFVTGQDDIVHAETLTYHFTADVHPELPLIVYSAPIDTDYHLWTMDINDPRVRHRLTDGARYALTPAFSADGDHVYFVEADENRQFHLKRIKTYGGAVQTIEIKEWDYGVASGAARLSVRDGDGQPITARVSIAGASGHPVASNTDATYMDTKTGRSYFYVEGNAEFTLPVGRYEVQATRGFFTPVQSAELNVKKGGESQVRLQFIPIWDAQKSGYVSADYHNHLNGDGTSRADHGDALRLMAGEDLEHMGSMSWNRWERRIDRDILGQRTVEGSFVVDQGQEVRSHTHAHIGINGIKVPYEPWFWGPNNPVLGDPDLANADVLDYAKRIGAFPTFVHPGIPANDPFADPVASFRNFDSLNELILQDGIGFEIISGWDGPMGNVQLWYRLLNIGKNVIGVSGTDGWVDFYRTAALGTARNFVPVVDGKDDFDSVLAAMVAGRGFLSTGPALLFRIDDNLRPGDVVESGPQNWSLTLASTSDVERVEIIVNGQVMDVHEGVKAGETNVLSGTLNLSEGGWVAARAYSTDWLDDPWPAMHKRVFAHSLPIWIGSIGSIDPGAYAASAADLLRALDATEEKARTAYGDRPITKLYGRYELARQYLNRSAQ